MGLFMGVASFVSGPSAIEGHVVATIQADHSICPLLKWDVVEIFRNDACAALRGGYKDPQHSKLSSANTKSASYVDQ